MSGSSHASLIVATGPCEQRSPQSTAMASRGAGCELLSTDVLPRHKPAVAAPAVVAGGPSRPPGVLTTAPGPASVQGVLLSMPRYTTPMRPAPYRPGETFMKNATLPGDRLPSAKMFANATKACELPVTSSTCSTTAADTAEELASTVGSEDHAVHSSAGAVEMLRKPEAGLEAPVLGTCPGAGDVEHSDALEAPVLGSAACPTVGSQGHHLGLCKPCAFLFKTGCQNGALCSFCHLCAPDEKKRRKKDWKEQRRAAVARAAWAQAAQAVQVTGVPVVAVPTVPGAWQPW